MKNKEADSQTENNLWLFGEEKRLQEMGKWSVQIPTKNMLYEMGT